MSDTVVIFGAGATKACGGPMTNEILPDAFRPDIHQEIEREGYMQLLEEFLLEKFYLPGDRMQRTPDHYPALPLLISLIDTAIARNQSMGPQWPTDRLRLVRRSLQYVIFALLEYKLRRLTHNHYKDLFRKLRSEPTVISLNYDVIADNAFSQCWGALPDYGCAIATERYAEFPHQGTLLKIHGSLNWSYCPNCDRLDLGVSESGKTYKLLDELYRVNPLEDRYSCQGYPCTTCETNVEAVLITPTQLKDYNNPHVRQVWLKAQQALREAKRAIIIGYSLPDDDLDVVYLLKRGLDHLAVDSPQDITVVEYDDKNPTAKIGEHPAGRRYRTIFGPDIAWRADGFEGFLKAFHG